jgi:hypothetical protein
MHRAETVVGRGGKLTEGLLIGHVRDHGSGVDAVGTNAFARSREPVLVNIGQHDVHTAACEPISQRKADPARRAGNHCNLPCTEIHAPPMLVGRPRPMFRRFVAPARVGCRSAVMGAGAKRDQRLVITSKTLGAPTWMSGFCWRAALMCSSCWPRMAFMAASSRHRTTAKPSPPVGSART